MMTEKLEKCLRKICEEILPQNELLYIYNSYDIVGDLAILRLADVSRNYVSAIAEAVMNVNTNVRTVLVQTGPVRGDFRLRKLEYFTGENKTTAVHRESGCRFFVDVKKCYFSPRLSHEECASQNKSKMERLL